MPERKNQHFVPRFLLERFSTPGTRDRAISAVDLDSEIWRDGISIAGQCSRPFYYGRDGQMEALLGELEGATAEAIRKLITLGPTRPPFDPHDAVTLLVFIAAQHGRTPAALSELEAQYRGLIERGLANAIPDPEERARGLEYLINRDLSPRSSTQSSVKIGSSLADLADVLVINESGLEFVTSDIGVSFHNEWGLPVQGVGTLGFACSGLQLFFPLSPRHLLVKYDAAIYAPPRPTVHVRSRDSVRTVNKLQCAYAERHIYFSGDGATRDDLGALLRETQRAPRSKNIHVDRLKQTDGPTELVIWYSEQARLNLRLPWLPIRRSMAAIPIQQRIHAWRPKAMEAIRANPHLGDPPPPPPAHLMGKQFKVDDS
jgi:hypothetical protein